MTHETRYPEKCTRNSQHASVVYWVGAVLAATAIEACDPRRDAEVEGPDCVSGDCPNEAVFSPSTDFEQPSAGGRTGSAGVGSGAGLGVNVSVSGLNHPFPLEGAHATTRCSNCHISDPPIFQGTPTECIVCHAEDRARVTVPNHAPFPSDCATCHTTVSFKGGTPETDDFVHPFALTGAHQAAACSSCHGNPPVYGGTPTDCIDCHGDDRASVTNPNHDIFPTDCSACHTTVAFKGGMPGADDFVHPFALTGAHTTAACTSCHGDPPVYGGTPTDCIDCHADDRAAVTDPSHENLPTDCAACHSTATFQGAMPGTDFEHPFPLTGAHQSAPCSGCHGDPPSYAGTPTECVACHRADYDSSPLPGHDTFPTDCAGCHSTSAFTPASGGLHPESRFPTNGRHNFACGDCHNADLGVTGRGNTDCVGCHLGAHARNRIDGEHRGVRGYPQGGAPPNFCLNCHPRGRED